MKKEYRDVLWKFIDVGIAPSMRDSVCLLNEVERLTTELDAVDSDLQLAVKRLSAEVERLTAEVDVLRGTFCEEECVVDGETMTRDRCGVCRKCAYRRGAEAMREAAAKRFDAQGIDGLTSAYFCNIIRATPVP